MLCWHSAPLLVVLDLLSVCAASLSEPTERRSSSAPSGLPARRSARQSRGGGTNLESLTWRESKWRSRRRSRHPCHRRPLHQLQWTHARSAFGGSAGNRFLSSSLIADSAEAGECATTGGAAPRLLPGLGSRAFATNWFNPQAKTRGRCAVDIISQCGSFGKTEAHAMDCEIDGVVGWEVEAEWSRLMG